MTLNGNKFDDLITALTDKDDKKAYELTKKISSVSESSNEYYSYIYAFASLLSDKKSYIRTRAFILCCSQARWDENGKLKEILPSLMVLLHDTKPTVLRQCLSSIKEVVIFRPELCKMISLELDKIDLSKYKESMASLIHSDILQLRNLIKEREKTE